jgi:hypothetical protein
MLLRIDGWLPTDLTLLYLRRLLISFCKLQHSPCRTLVSTSWRHRSGNKTEHTSASSTVRSAALCVQLFVTLNISNPFSFLATAVQHANSTHCPNDYPTANVVQNDWSCMRRTSRCRKIGCRARQKDKVVSVFNELSTPTWRYMEEWKLVEDVMSAIRPRSSIPLEMLSEPQNRRLSGSQNWARHCGGPCPFLESYSISVDGIRT